MSQGISVVNMSLGDGRNYTNLDQGSRISDLIHELRNNDVAVVVAAGNEYFNWKAEGMAFPAICRDTISVGAVFDGNNGPIEFGDGARANSTAAGRFTPFSQRLHKSTSADSFTTIFAPGSIITSSGFRDPLENPPTMQLSRDNHGTSMAAPFVAGTIALMQQHYKRETGKLPSVDLLEECLIKGALRHEDGDEHDDNVPHTGKFYPVLDAAKAIRLLDEAI